MRNLLIAVAAVAFVFPSFTAVADGSGSDGGPVLAAGIGSAVAGEDFTITHGVDASPISDLESARIRGTGAQLLLNSPTGKIQIIPADLFDILQEHATGINCNGTCRSVGGTPVILTFP